MRISLATATHKLSVITSLSRARTSHTIRVFWLFIAKQHHNKHPPFLSEAFLSLNQKNRKKRGVRTYMMLNDLINFSSDAPKRADTNYEIAHRWWFAKSRECKRQKSISMWMLLTNIAYDGWHANADWPSLSIWKRLIFRIVSYFFLVYLLIQSIQSHTFNLLRKIYLNGSHGM